MFRKLRESIGTGNIKKKSAKIKRDRVVHNFKTARSASILFDANENESFTHIRQFKSFLEKQNIKTELLGYVDEDEIPDDLLLWEHCHVYCKKDLTFLYKIKQDLTKDFLDNSFDILFDLSLNDHLPLVSLSSLSKSKFKVGRYKETFNDYDLMINIDKNKRIDYFIEQIKNYVSILNN